MLNDFILKMPTHPQTRPSTVVMLIYQRVDSTMVFPPRHRIPTRVFRIIQNSLRPQLFNDQRLHQLHNLIIINITPRRLLIHRNPLRLLPLHRCWCSIIIHTRRSCVVVWKRGWPPTRLTIQAILNGGILYKGILMSTAQKVRLQLFEVEFWAFCNTGCPWKGFKILRAVENLWKLSSFRNFADEFYFISQQ